MKRPGATRAAALIVPLVLSLLASVTFGETSDLIYKSLDLKYAVEEIRGSPLSSGQKENRASGEGSALKSEVVDLKAAGAEIEESATEIKISLQGEILFDFDKADIRPAAEPVLTQITEMIKKYPKPNVVIDGHTDGKGSQTYNLKLSDRRAASVKTWLAAHGIAERGVRTNGLGASKPVAPNTKPDGADDPEGRQKNRRVEITIKK